MYRLAQAAEPPLSGAGTVHAEGVPGGTLELRTLPEFVSGRAVAGFHMRPFAQVALCAHSEGEPGASATGGNRHSRLSAAPGCHVEYAMLSSARASASSLLPRALASGVHAHCSTRLEDECSLRISLAPWVDPGSSA